MSRARLIELAVAVIAAVVLATALFLPATGGSIERISTAERLYSEAVDLASTDEAASTARFAESAAILAEELAVHDTSGIRFNRANALLRAGDLGGSIAEYRAALLRAPSDASIAANLAEARRKVVNAPSPAEERPIEGARALWGVLSERLRLGAAAILLLAGFLFLALPHRRTALSAACFALGALLATTVAVDLATRSTTSLAVLREPSMLRKGNGDGFDAALAEALPIGTECRILESRPGWLEVELGDSLRGWVKDTSIVRVD